MRTAVKYNIATKVITGTVQVSIDSDLSLNIGNEEAIIEIPIDHPFFGTSSDEWEIKTNASGVSKVIRKPEDVIQKQRAEKAGKKMKTQFVALYAPVLKEMNELRKKIGLPEKTINEMYANQ